PPTDVWRRTRLRAPEQDVRLIADERRVLPGAPGRVPGRKLGKPRIALVGLGLNEVGEEAQLLDERLEHLGGLDASVRGAEPRQARRSHWQRHDWVIAAVELRIQRHPGVGRPPNVPDATTRSGAVPITHRDRTVTVEERVVRRPVVVTDDLMRARRDDAPSSVRRRDESGK